MSKPNAKTSAEALLALLSKPNGDAGNQGDQLLTALTENIQTLLDSHSELQEQLETFKTEATAAANAHKEEITALTAGYEKRIKELETHKLSNDQFAAKVMAHTGIAPIETDDDDEGGSTPETRTIAQHVDHYKTIKDGREKAAYYQAHIHGNI